MTNTAPFPIQITVLDSLQKLLPEQSPPPSAGGFSAMRNEPFSFQIAYRLNDSQGDMLPFYPIIETDLPVSLYSVGYVPVLQTNIHDLDDHYRPGLLPDILIPKRTNPRICKEGFPWVAKHYEAHENNQLQATRDSWQALWLTINEKGTPLKAGNYTITVRLCARQSAQCVGEVHIHLQLIDALLPMQKLRYTNWFHCDCLCDTYGVTPFSERFYEIFRSFATSAARHGMNMILLPAFTPPLDTPFGKARMTVQLVDICYENGVYRFDFTKMRRFIEESRKCGIRYFEHAHLFTQWGATAAPKIIATVNGQPKQIFGWNTPATCKRYNQFLHAYIPAVRAFFDSMKLGRKVLFHVSDEPGPTCAESYRAAKNSLGTLLDGCTVGDALSHYDFYADGTVQMPIVNTRACDEFIGRCRNWWAYYTGGEHQNGMSNRLINNTSERNRMIGIALYYHNIQGFLHWGFNYYYDELSHGLFDPKLNPNGFNGACAGTSFSVYPATDGTALPSIRQKVFYEAINDMRAMQLLEKLTSRETATALIERFYGKVTFSTPVESREKLLSFRNALNAAIRAAIQ